MFHTATNESTAAPSEKTAVLPGKATNNMEKEMKRFIKLKLSVHRVSSFCIRCLFVRSEMVNKIYIV